MSAAFAWSTSARARDAASLAIDDLPGLVAGAAYSGYTMLYAVTVIAAPTTNLFIETLTSDGVFAGLEWTQRTSQLITCTSPDAKFRVQTWFAWLPPDVVIDSDSVGSVVATPDGTAQDFVFIIGGVTDTMGFDARESNPTIDVDFGNTPTEPANNSQGLTNEAGGMLVTVIATSGATDPTPGLGADLVQLVETATIESEESTTPLRVMLQKIDLAFGSTGWKCESDTDLARWQAHTDGIATGTFAPPSSGVFPALTVLGFY